LQAQILFHGWGLVGLLRFEDCRHRGTAVVGDWIGNASPWSIRSVAGVSRVELSRWLCEFRWRRHGNNRSRPSRSWVDVHSKANFAMLPCATLLRPLFPIWEILDFQASEICLRYRQVGYQCACICAETKTRKHRNFQIQLPTLAEPNRPLGKLGSNRGGGSTFCAS